MKYGELVRFEPIESIIKLHSSDEAEQARRLVETYVISERMRDTLAAVVFPQLRFDGGGGAVVDNKGLLVVGNYGTGKSHLMAVISAVAERPELADGLTCPDLVPQARALAGKFQVIRAEIGAVEGSLRDILCGVLQRGLAKLQVDFHFRSASEVGENNKRELERMMEAFHGRYPDQGLLLVIDELLDFLRGRRDFELVRDFGFLRELGEVCGHLRFRFLGGVQEALFDNPSFQFASETLRRVQARFESVRIHREDVAFVVQERLLRKTPQQRGRIREHLERFTPLYASMSERLERFVALYPVHPAFLEVFEQVYAAEKREVLKTLSQAIRTMVDKPVPTDDPGLLSYDAYWSEFLANPAYRADPNIRTVIERSQTLQNRIDQGFKGPALARLKPLAVRLIHALSVQRLAGNDIHAPIGVTVESLRDDLALTVPGAPAAMQTAEFLKTTVESTLREILKAVAGQFLTCNPENGQYYLDVQKDTDFDALIEQRTENLSHNEQDRYYFDALLRLLDQPEAGRRGDFYIWEHQIPWQDRNAERLGYLFFGAPTERSTAQPPRDYYLYFLQAFDPPRFTDEQRPDEVFFRLVRRDEDFDQELRLYAAARLLALTAGGSRAHYEEKANLRLRKLVDWLRQNLSTAFEVTHQGVSKPLGEWMRGFRGGADDVREVVRTVGSVALAGHFAERYPDYPRFKTPVTEKNRAQLAQDALKHLAGITESQHSRAVLDALELFQGSEIRPLDHRDPQAGSRYARHFWQLLTARGPGQVLNRGDLFERPFPGVEYDREFRLEPDWVVVVLGALVRSENVTLALAGRNVDASNVKDLGKLALAELVQFKYVSRPKDFDSSALRELFRLADLADGLALDVEQGSDAAVQQLQMRLKDLGERLVRGRKGLAQCPAIWGTPLLPEEERAALLQQLGPVQELVDGLQALNTPARLKNLRASASDLGQARARLDGLAQAEELARLADQMAPLVNYLVTAEGLLPSDHPWIESLRAGRDKVRASLLDPQSRGLRKGHEEIRTTLEALKASYAEAYGQLHGKARLTGREDQRKSRLLKSPSLQKLRTLAGQVPHLPTGRLQDLEARLGRLVTCFSLEPGDLEQGAFCPHCQHRPVEEPQQAPALQRLEALEQEVEALLAEWTGTLLQELEDPMTRANLDLLTAPSRALVEAFLAERLLPEPLNNEFLRALAEALSGLERVSLTLDELGRRLEEGGMPCTVEELRSRFERLLEQRVQGHERSKVRLVLEAPGAAR